MLIKMRILKLLHQALNLRVAPAPEPAPKELPDIIDLNQADASGGFGAVFFGQGNAHKLLIQQLENKIKKEYLHESQKLQNLENFNKLIKIGTDKDECVKVMTKELSFYEEVTAVEVLRGEKQFVKQSKLIEKKAIKSVAYISEWFTIDLDQSYIVNSTSPITTSKLYFITMKKMIPINTFMYKYKGFFRVGVKRLFGNEPYPISYFNNFALMNFVIPIWEDLKKMHAVNICHRDIKPINILVDPGSKKAVLIDYGLVRLVTGEHSEIKIQDKPIILSRELKSGTRGYFSSELIALSMGDYYGKTPATNINQYIHPFYLDDESEQPITDALAISYNKSSTYLRILDIKRYFEREAREINTEGIKQDIINIAKGSDRFAFAVTIADLFGPIVPLYTDKNKQLHEDTATRFRKRWGYDLYSSLPPSFPENLTTAETHKALSVLGKPVELDIVALDEQVLKPKPQLGGKRIKADSRIKRV